MNQDAIERRPALLRFAVNFRRVVRTVLELSLWTAVMLFSATTCLAQSLGPAAPHSIWAVDSMSSFGCGCRFGEVGWEARGCIDWQAYA